MKKLQKRTVIKAYQHLIKHNGKCIGLECSKCPLDMYRTNSNKECWQYIDSNISDACHEDPIMVEFCKNKLFELLLEEELRAK